MQVYAGVEGDRLEELVDQLGVKCCNPPAVEVAARLDLQVQQPMASREGEHVVEERNAGADLGPAGAVQVERQPDLRLSSAPVDRGAPLRHRGPPAAPSAPARVPPDPPCGRA